MNFTFRITKQLVGRAIQFQCFGRDIDLLLCYGERIVVFVCFANDRVEGGRVKRFRNGIAEVLLSRFPLIM